MDSPRSEVNERAEFYDTLVSVREAARRGDWLDAGRLARRLAVLPPPNDAAQAWEYLERLRQTVIDAKASRAHMLATLGSSSCRN